MKWAHKLLKKLRPQWSSAHEDHSTSGHLKKALFEDLVPFDKHGQLPKPDPEDWVALSAFPSHNGQDESPPANTSITANNKVFDAGDVSPDAQAIQEIHASSGCEVAPVYPMESTRMDVSLSDARDTDVSSLPYISSPDFTRLKRIESSTSIQKLSPGRQTTSLLDATGNSQAPDNISEGPDHQELTTDEQDHLGPFYNQNYHPQPVLDNSDPLNSIMSVEDHPEIKPDRSHCEGPNLDQQHNPEPFEEGKSYSGSSQNIQHDDLLGLQWADPSNRILDISHPESVLTGAQDFSEAAPHRPDRPQCIPDHQYRAEFAWETLEPSMRISDEQVYLGMLKRPDEQLPDTARPDYPEFFSDEQDQPQTILARSGKAGHTSNRQSRSGSFRSQKSLVSRGEQRRLRREARLYNLLSRNLQTKARAYEKRSQLRQSRFEISIADESFMRFVREKRNQGNQDDLSLEASFSRLQDARNKHGPLEEAYNALEEQVNREEYEAKELQEKLLKSETRKPDSDIDTRSSSANEYDSDTSEIIRVAVHPLYDAYLSRLGDVDLCREALSELMIEREELLQAQATRRTVGRELSPDDLITLRNFPTAEAKLVDELRMLEEDTEILRLECAREGLFGENEIEEEIDDGNTVEEIVLFEPSPGLPSPEETEYNKYSLLLERPAEKEEEDKSKVLLTDFKEGDVGDRITCWLLHKLRLSGLEAELLARYMDGLDRTADTEKWQEGVLENWFFDSANLPASAYQAEPTFTAFRSSPLTDLSKGARKRSNSEYLLQVVVRSSALSQNLEFGTRLRLPRMKGTSAITV